MKNIGSFEETVRARGAERSRAGESGVAMETMEKKKVLIVDDQVGIRVLLVEVFSAEGYETYQASNGKSALEIVREKRPDLVLLDMKIPGMDGLEILKHIREYDPSIKVIMMTAYGELAMIRKATDLGALMHFTKPFDIDELRAAVKHELGQPEDRMTGS